MEKVLLVRIDGIGDLVCTMPVQETEYLKSKDLTWFVNVNLGRVLKLYKNEIRFLEINKKFSISQFFKIINYLKLEKFNSAIFFHAPWWIALALFISKVPNRVGVKSQWFSFLFFNKGLRQKRSQSVKHELDYNCELISVLSGQIEPTPKNFSFVKKEPKDYILIHPGMKGSAKNWSTSNYKKLIEELSLKFQIVLTGDKQDEKIYSNFKNLKVIWKIGQQSFDEWIECISQAKAVIGPSTGVIHLASRFGIPTIGIFSPVLVQSPVRWAPLGRMVKVFVPKVDCPAQRKCLQMKCEKFDCLDQIDYKEIINEIESVNYECYSRN